MSSEEIRNELSSLLVDNNERLNVLRDGIEEALTEEYKRGLNDAWEIAQKVVLDDSVSYSNDEIIDIFNTGNQLHILREYCGVTVMNEVRAYEIRKKKETMGFRCGDIVEYYSGGISRVKAIFLRENDKTYEVLDTDFDVPQVLDKSIFTLCKTGKSVDLE